MTRGSGAVTGTSRLGPVTGFRADSRSGRGAVTVLGLMFELFVEPAAAGAG